MMTQFDYDAIILGQGLAGTSLAWHLRWRRQRILIVDRQFAGTSSRVAAGLMTPITGQKLVKTWRWETLWPAAVAFYQKVEQETATRFFEPRNTVRLLASERECEFVAQRWDTEFAGLVEQPKPLVNAEWFAEGTGGFEMVEGGRLAVATFLDASRLQFQAIRQYARADLDVRTDIELIPDGVCVPTLAATARRLIFCQGIDAAQNSWFPNARFKPAKGEILTLRINGLAEERIVSRGIWLMPIGGGLFRAGATYEWRDLNSVPTAAGRDQIVGRLREFLRLPFEVVGHDAAVRPILVHQYPVVGVHPQHPQLGYFNGLGSKGALQAPWLAGHLADFLYGTSSLDMDVDLRLYEPPPTRSIGEGISNRPLTSLTARAHAIIATVLRPGDVAIDGTVGNGYDTLFLAKAVGPTGVVYGFDIQSSALEVTSRKLSESGLTNVSLFERSHAEMPDALPSMSGNVAAVMLNLGYRPGGDKQLTTQSDSTICALRDGANLLRAGGVLTVLAYTGHQGGLDEAAAVVQFLKGLDPAMFEIDEPSPTSDRLAAPRLFVVRKRREAPAKETP